MEPFSRTHAASRGSDGVERGRRSRLSASHVRSVRPPDLHLASPLLASTRTRLAHVSIQAWFPRPPGAHYVTPLPYILRSTMKDRPRRLCRRFLLSRNRRGRRSHSRPLAPISTIDSLVVVLHWKAHPRDTVRSVGTYAAQAPLARRQIQSSGTSHVPPWQNAASTPLATPQAKAWSSPSFAQHAWARHGRRRPWSVVGHRACAPVSSAP